MANWQKWPKQAEWPKWPKWPTLAWKEQTVTTLLKNKGQGRASCDFYNFPEWQLNLLVKSIPWSTRQLVVQLSSCNILEVMAKRMSFWHIQPTTMWGEEGGGAHLDDIFPDFFPFRYKLFLIIEMDGKLAKATEETGIWHRPIIQFLGWSLAVAGQWPQ